MLGGMQCAVRDLLDLSVRPSLGHIGFLLTLSASSCGLWMRLIPKAGPVFASEDEGFLVSTKIEKVIISDSLVDSLCVTTTSSIAGPPNVEGVMEAQALRDSSSSFMVSVNTTTVIPILSIMTKSRGSADKSDRLVNDLIWRLKSLDMEWLMGKFNLDRLSFRR